MINTKLKKKVKGKENKVKRNETGEILPKKPQKRELMNLPNQQTLNQVWEYIVQRPNKKGEYKRAENESLFLLCWKVGLRISEAINFDLNLRHEQPEYKNLYQLRGKGNKERWVFVSDEVVRELKLRKWKPGKNNRISFFFFLAQIKKEMGLPVKTELAPHTLRRCFATYNHLNGMPLPVLQKVLGHNSLGTTGKYVRAGTLENLVKYRPI